MFRLVLVLVFGIAFLEAYNEGDPCNKDGVVGVCTDLKKCSSAQSDGRDLHMCRQKGSDKFVCCTDLENNRSKRYASQHQTNDECEPLDSSISPPKTGRQAWDKCIEYQQKLAYPCEPSIEPGETKRRKYNCNLDSYGLVGGSVANRGQFLHMALLGYEKDKIVWLCSGSVISEKFILTVAHCINARSAGHVTNVKVGTMSRSDDNGIIYKVKSTFIHPDYKPPSSYNDIALVETEKEIEFNSFVIPACLPVDLGKVEKAELSSWLNDRSEKNSDEMHKFTMVKFSDANCSSTYQPSRKQVNGIDFKSQLCFGHGSGDPDACRVLSGAPLQVRNKRISCMYTLVGVTSFGTPYCVTPTPDVYSKVEFFMPWIESIVFP